MTHGVLECVERDALARAHRTHGFLHHRRIDPATIDHDEVLVLLDELAAKGLLVGLWLAPSPVGLPVIWCHLMESGPREMALLHLPAEGSAAALDPAAAIVHAIHEAAQARLAAISGARDDLTRACYPKHPDWEMIAAHRRLITDGPRDIDFAALSADTPRRSQAALPDLLARLEAGGMGSLLVISLDTGPCEELAAVQVVIPSFILFWRDPMRPKLVFTGPTLSHAEAQRAADVICLAPAVQGSVVAAVQRYDPAAILIVDGGFQSEPAVRHKEILWAISQGVPVIGAASMGALRAAELHPHMRGVGLVYRWYRRNAFAPDDAVAVLHGPAAADFSRTHRCPCRSAADRASRPASSADHHRRRGSAGGCGTLPEFSRAHAGAHGSRRPAGPR